MARRARPRTARSERSASAQDDSPPSPDQAAAEDPQALARQICLRLLTLRARTRAELATTLARRGIDAAIAEQVLVRFSEVGLIDDAAFAESYVHSGHVYQGLGRRALAVRLRRRGVDEQTAGEALAAVDPESEAEMARALVRRRLPRDGRALDQASQARTVQRLVGLLARRGYPEGLSYRVVREELRAAGQQTALLDGIDLDPDPGEDRES